MLGTETRDGQPPLFYYWMILTTESYSALDVDRRCHIAII